MGAKKKSSPLKGTKESMPCLQCFHNENPNGNACVGCHKVKGKFSGFVAKTAVEEPATKSGLTVKHLAAAAQSVNCGLKVTFHPKSTQSHYDGSGCDVIEFIRQQRGDQACAEFCIGNVIKYAFRIGRKVGEHPRKDLRKIIDYANRAIACFPPEETDNAK